MDLRTIAETIKVGEAEVARAEGALAPLLQQLKEKEGITDVNDIPPLMEKLRKELDAASAEEEKLLTCAQEIIDGINSRLPA